MLTANGWNAVMSIATESLTMSCLAGIETVSLCPKVTVVGALVDAPLGSCRAMVTCPMLSGRFANRLLRCNRRVCPPRCGVMTMRTVSSVKLFGVGCSVGSKVGKLSVGLAVQLATHEFAEHAAG